MQTRMRIGVRPGRAEMNIECARDILEGLRGVSGELRQRGGRRIGIAGMRECVRAVVGDEGGTVSAAELEAGRVGSPVR
jgi:hypothetical protein